MEELPTTVDGALALIDQEWERWHRALDAAHDRYLEPFLSDDWSPKDLVAHITVYDQVLLAALNPARPIEFPVPMPGSIANQTIEVRNRWIHETLKTLPDERVRAESEEVHAAMRSAVSALHDDDLGKHYRITGYSTEHMTLTPSTEGADRTLSVVRLMAGETWHHYGEHADQLNQALAPVV
ncbi:MAG: DinB family protein [Candidatus Dormibacteria bacterium]